MAKDPDDSDEKTEIASGWTQFIKRPSLGKGGKSRSQNNRDSTQKMARDLELDFTRNAPSQNLPAGPLSQSAGKIHHEETVMLKRPESVAASRVDRFWRRLAYRLGIPGFSRSREPYSSPPTPAGGKLRSWVVATATAAILGWIGYDLFLSAPEEERSRSVRLETFRPKMPGTPTRPDPLKSSRLYDEAMKDYVSDTLVGYRRAADKLLLSATLDPGNVKALAMLVSCDLNLIDVSMKDERFFTVVSKLMEMTRTRGIDLPETVIANVEYFLAFNQPEAAQSRIVDYSRTHPQYGAEMFYYLALSFYQRGEMSSAVRYISQYPEQKISNPRVFYLRGRIAEALNNSSAATQEYQKAIQQNAWHSKSRLRLAALYAAGSNPASALPHLEKILSKPQLLPPKDLGLAYFLYAKAMGGDGKIAPALQAIERATRLDRDNSVYLLELYGLRYKSGERSWSLRKDARMYFFLAEGQKAALAGRTQEALTQYLQARQANENSPLPFLKIGDLFLSQFQLSNAKLNYEKAVSKARQNPEVWAKYIDVLIQGYEWGEAQKAIEKFQALVVSSSVIDRMLADLYSKQGRQIEAQAYYKRALSGDAIDPLAYLGYAKSLLAAKKYVDAQFFFSLALRFDPLNYDALSGFAQCIADTESIDRAISFLQAELKKTVKERVRLVDAVAEFQIQKGELDQAQANLEQARAIDPEYPRTYRLQAMIHLAQEGSDRYAIAKALDAFRLYSDKNPSDPIGYLERYRIFAKRTEFDKALGELDRVYAALPKYPGLHHLKGLLFSSMGNHRQAAAEYQIELNNNAGNAESLLGLGRALIELDSAQEALKNFTQAMQIQPRSAEAKQMAGYANYRLKNYAAAIALYQAALSLDRGNPVIYKRLGLALRDSGDARAASENFRKYLEMEPDAQDRAEFEKFL